MPEINKIPYREPYTPTHIPSSSIDKIASTGYKETATTVSFSPSDAKYLIIPVYMGKDGKYKVAKDVGKAGAEDEEKIATDILIYDLKTKGKPDRKDLKSLGITDSTQPGIDLCEYIGRHYPKTLLAMEKVLKYLESKRLEDIISTYIVKTDENAEAVAERVDKETSGEKEYKSEEEKAEYKGEGEPEEEVETTKKEAKGEEKVTEKSDEMDEGGPPEEAVEDSEGSSK